MGNFCFGYECKVKNNLHMQDKKQKSYQQLTNVENYKPIIVTYRHPPFCLKSWRSVVNFLKLNILPVHLLNDDFLELFFRKLKLIIGDADGFVDVS